ncbi:hypothetical protein Dip510_000408 [Elusimicrobium posterum]|uniref:hypothetical protein n=1 Tax=Elusimicrobium posterum TaxID=3116653 RepID=UPI003C7546B6
MKKLATLAVVMTLTATIASAQDAWKDLGKANTTANSAELKNKAATNATDSINSKRVELKKSLAQAETKTAAPQLTAEQTQIADFNTEYNRFIYSLRRNDAANPVIFENKVKNAGTLQVKVEKAAAVINKAAAKHAKADVDAVNKKAANAKEIYNYALQVKKEADALVATRVKEGAGSQASDTALKASIEKYYAPTKENPGFDVLSKKLIEKVAKAKGDASTITVKEMKEVIKADALDYAKKAEFEALGLK